MEALKNIFNRRSIRKYENRPLSQEHLRTLLEAAQFAPSAVNKQPWHFIVVDRRELMDKIMEIHPHAGMLKTASHAVIICGDEQLQHDNGYWIADCGAATQNLLLAAHAIGAGSCWVGLYPREQRMKDIAGLLGLPDHVKPFALVSLGYPAENKEQPERFRKDKVFLNGWGQAFTE